MSTPRSTQAPATPIESAPAIPLQPSSAVTVIGGDGAAVATITRRTEQQPGGTPLVVVAATDDLDQDSAPALRSALLESLRPDRRVCCDLSGVTFFGAAGAHAMLDVQRRAQAAGAHFTVRGARGITREVLEFVGLPSGV